MVHSDTGTSLIALTFSVIFADHAIESRRFPGRQPQPAGEQVGHVHLLAGTGRCPASGRACATPVTRAHHQHGRRVRAEAVPSARGRGGVHGVSSPGPARAVGARRHKDQPGERGTAPPHELPGPAGEHDRVGRDTRGPSRTARPAHSERRCSRLDGSSASTRSSLRHRVTSCERTDIDATQFEALVALARSSDDRTARDALAAAVTLSARRRLRGVRARGMGSGRGRSPHETFGPVLSKSWLR